MSAGGEEFSLQRSGDGWTAFDAKGAGRKANAKAVQELLGRLTAADLVRGFAAADSKDEAKGFSAPAAKIALYSGLEKPEKTGTKAKPKGDAAAVLTFGKEASDVVNVRRQVGKSTLDVLIPGDVLALARRKRIDYVEVAVPPLSPEQVKGVAFNRGDVGFEFERDDKPGSVNLATWTIKAPKESAGRMADPDKVFDLLNALSFVAVRKVVDDAPTADTLARLGLAADKPRLKATLKLKDGADRVYVFGSDTPDKLAVYAKTEDGIAFETDRGPVDKATQGDVLDMVVYRADPAKITGVKLSGWKYETGLDAPVSWEFALKDGRWAFKGDKKPPIPLDPAKVEDLIRAAMRPKAEAFVTPKGVKPEHKLTVDEGALKVELLGDGGPIELDARGDDERRQEFVRGDEQAAGRRGVHGAGGGIFVAAGRAEGVPDEVTSASGRWTNWNAGCGNSCVNGLCSRSTRLPRPTSSAGPASPASTSMK